MGQHGIVAGDAIKTGEQVLAGNGQDGGGVGAVEQATGHGPMAITATAHRSFIVKGAAPGAILAFELVKFAGNRLGCLAKGLQGQFSLAHRDQLIESQVARLQQLPIRAMQGRAALLAALTAAATGALTHGSTSRLSPWRRIPGTITLVKMPSRGMMQSPTCLKMAQP